MPSWIVEGNETRPGDDEMRSAAKWLQILYNSSGEQPSPFPEGLAPFPGDDLQRLYQKIRYMQGGAAAGSGVGGEDEELLNILSNYWTLDEASGTRFPCYGALNFTEIGTVGSVAGKDGSAADFGAEEQLVTSNFALLLPYTIAFWYYEESGGSGVWDEGGILLYQYDGVRSRTFQISDPVGGEIYFNAAVTIPDSLNIGSINFDEWNLIVGMVDSNGVIKGCVNGGALITGNVISVNPGSGPLQIGSINTPNPEPKIDSLFIFSDALSQAQVDQLWNNGDGFFPACVN